MVAERVTPSTDPKNRTRHFPDGSEAVHGTSRTGQKPYMAGHKPYTIVSMHTRSFSSRTRIHY